MASDPEIREEIVRRLRQQGNAIYAPNWRTLHQRLCPKTSLRQFKLAFNSLVYNSERRMISVRRPTLGGLYSDTPRTIHARLIGSGS